MLSRRLTSDKAARTLPIPPVVVILPRDIDLPLHTVVVDRAAPVMLDDEVTSHARHVDTAGAIAAHVNRPRDVIDLDLTRAVLIDVHRALDTAHVDSAGRIADPHIATSITHANVAGGVLDSRFRRDALDG